MDLKRLRQVLYYGWRHAYDIQSLIEQGEFSRFKGILIIFADIIKCYMSYSMWSNQYKQLRFYSLSDEERESVGNEIKKTNIAKSEWTDYFYESKRFFAKWSSSKYECSYRLQNKRNNAYMKRYRMGDNCRIRNNVLLTSTHGRIGHLQIGCNCTFGRNIDIDYTGGLIIGNNVSLNIGCVILTHNHTIFNEKGKSAVVENPLCIGDNVIIGANSTILAGVREIGRYSVISAGSVVKSKVPPYAVVMGNPAKIVWFKWTPKQVAEFEETNYDVNDRIDINEYENLYKTYYRENVQEIKRYMSMEI